jgi:microcin C transport system substrate-binding protein
MTHKGFLFLASLFSSLLGQWGSGGIAGQVSHGLSAFGDLKYSENFTHFDYVNPQAPKGGILRLAGIDSFDSLNPFILKGVEAQGIGLIYGTLMERAMDEPDARYAYIAKGAAIASDKRSIRFDIHPQAVFSDGSPITASDVVYSFNALIKEGHPQFKVIYSEVERAEIEGEGRVVFHFKTPGNRDLFLQLSDLPVLSEKYFSKVPFGKTSMEPPVSSGPYFVEKVEPGRSITYRRIPNYWANQIPVMRGRYNFNQIKVEYFRDRSVAFEAFFAGAYDFREEFTSRAWATQYDRPPVRIGKVKRHTLTDHRPSGVQAFFLNQRRGKFQDRRVRLALDLAFDFEWTNKTLFYGLYKRTNSMYENSDLAARSKPEKGELDLLLMQKDQLPNEVLLEPYRSPQTDGSGRNRVNLRKAARLLREAGWRIEKNQRLVNSSGYPLTIEFLLFEASFTRIINPYVQNLKRIGVSATIRIVDVANFQNRLKNFDFDIIVQRYIQPNTPGIEQKTYFSSEMADTPGTRNLAGIKNPAVDFLITKIIDAQNRKSLVSATRALDRVLMWNHYVIPQWYKGAHNIAYWDKYSYPATKPKYDLGVLDTWWYDVNKAKHIDAK